MTAITTDQLPLFADVTAEPPHRRRTPAERKVADLLKQLHEVNEQLNSALYAAKSSERPKIHNPSEAFDLLRGTFALEQEELRVILLNTRNQVLQIVTVYRGSVNCSQIRCGEVFREAIRQNAVAIIVSHNHPSHDPTPSPDDVAVTRAFVQAGKLLDIDVLDHLIVGAGNFVSLKERGLGFS